MQTSTLSLWPVACRWLLPLWLAGASAWAGAQVTPPDRAPAERRIEEWLARLHDAAHAHSYTGSFVVSSSAGDMASGRVWHAEVGGRPVEKVEFLTGEPRITLRRDEQLVTLLPGQRLVRLEQHKSPRIFPDLIKAHRAPLALAEFYEVRLAGRDRVAGLDTDVSLVSPRDGQRFGYRIWSDQRSGLVVKLQTLGQRGEVLEQAGFSELQLDAPVRGEAIVRAMSPPEGWRVERVDSVRTTAAAEGWLLRGGAPGFTPMDCWRRRIDGREGFLQCGFTDGLASVSLFIERYDPQRPAREGVMASGATHTLTRRVQDHWLTAVGEVPPQTLRSFAQGLERKP